jgi:hypothetical protein
MAQVGVESGDHAIHGIGHGRAESITVGEVVPSDPQHT